MKVNGITCLDYHEGGDGSLTFVLDCTAEKALEMDTLIVNVVTDEGDIAERFVNLVKVSATVDAQSKQVSLRCAAATGDMAKAVTDIVEKVDVIERAVADVTGKADIAQQTADEAKELAESAGNPQVSTFAALALAPMAADMTDADAISVSSLWPEWSGDGVAYETGDVRNYDAHLYRCAQNHTSQPDWTPDTAASLWSRIDVAGDGVDVWTQPTGAHNAYNTGDRVHYPTASDPIYVSTIDGNTWSPDAYPQGWQLEPADE